MVSDAVADFGEQRGDPLLVVALDFEQIVLDCPARATGVFQACEQFNEVVVGGRQSADDGHQFAFRAFFNRDAGPLFFRRLAGRRGRRQRRALAGGFQFAAALTARRSIPRRTLEQSHDGGFHSGQRKHTTAKNDREHGTFSFRGVTYHKRSLAMLVLLFDIDGTLISTGGAGLNALRATMREEFGIAEPNDVPVSGRTDRGIARDLFRAHELAETEDHWQRFLDSYLRHLADQLPRTRGRVLPGVAQLLDALQGLERVRLGLLTGNVQAGARLKLRHYGLEDYFAFGGFGDRHADRDSVAAEALDASRVHLPAETQPDRVWVIGDTPMDITCARSISARCVAVATGSFPREALEAYSPDLAVDNLDRLDHLLEVLVG